MLRTNETDLLLSLPYYYTHPATRAGGLPADRFKGFSSRKSA